MKDIQCLWFGNALVPCRDTECMLYRLSGSWLEEMDSHDLMYLSRLTYTPLQQERRTHFVTGRYTAFSKDKYPVRHHYFHRVAEGAATAGWRLSQDPVAEPNAWYSS